MIFGDFGLILGGPGTSKNYQKSLKIAFGARSERIARSMVALGRFWKLLETVLGWFWKDLGKVLDGFRVHFCVFWEDDQ